MLLLLRYDASSSIINGTAQIPKDVTEDDEIITMLEGTRNWTFFPPLFSLISPADLVVLLIRPLFAFSAAERRETRRLEEKLLGAAREGDISVLSNMVRIFCYSCEIDFLSADVSESTTALPQKLNTS